MASLRVLIWKSGGRVMEEFGGWRNWNNWNKGGNSRGWGEVKLQGYWKKW